MRFYVIAYLLENAVVTFSGSVTVVLRVQTTIKHILVSVRGKRLTVELPLDLHRDFAIKCIREGRKMSQVIRELVGLYVAGKVKLDHEPKESQC